MKKPLISLVLVSFNMTREIPRVLRTLSVPYQKGFQNGDIEIIVVDNGSVTPPDKTLSPQNVRLLSMDHPTVSPARAINLGLGKAQAELIGVFIDGARMASPGLCKIALLASRLHHRPIISTLGFHLGPEVQMKSVENGYDQEVEDQLLASVPWQKEGYELFRISVFAGSSGNGWFMPIAESNALFLTRDMWNELGGYDEQFVSPGGGLVNLDTYIRACELPDSELITLLGEGTFHQVHGGIATNQKNPQASWNVFHEEYVKIRKKPFTIPERRSLFFGTIPQQAHKSIRLSADKLTSSR